MPANHGSSPSPAAITRPTAPPATTHFDSFTQFSCLCCHAHDQAPTDSCTPAWPELRLRERLLPAAAIRRRVRGALRSQGHLRRLRHLPPAGRALRGAAVAGFTHLTTNGADCGSCHATTSWSAGAVPRRARRRPDARPDPHRPRCPSWAGDLASPPPRSSRRRCPMDDEPRHHGAGGDHARELRRPATPARRSGAYYPGRAPLLARQSGRAPAGRPAPTATPPSQPTGFVGPLASTPARNPPSGEMKHDAVAWSGGAPTATEPSRRTAASATPVPRHLPCQLAGRTRRGGRAAARPARRRGRGRSPAPASTATPTRGP